MHQHRPIAAAYGPSSARTRPPAVLPCASTAPFHSGHLLNPFFRGEKFCACGTAGFPASQRSKLLSPPTPALFFCTFSVARLYRRSPLWRVQTFAPPHSPSMLPGQSVPSYRSPGAAPATSGNQLPASSPTALHQGGECRCGRSWLPYLAQHIAAVTRHKGHATSGTDARQE